MKKFVLIILFSSVAFAKYTILGKCPNITAVQNFNGSQYLGTWYEFSRYFVLNELGGKCNSASYTLQDDGTVKVINSHVNSITGMTSTIEATAKFVGKEGEARFSVVYPSSLISMKGYYSILDTDYSNYSIIFTCKDFGFFHISSAWVLTRARFPEKEVIDKVYEIFDAAELDKQYLIKTNQEGCETL